MTIGFGDTEATGSLDNSSDWLGPQPCGVGSRGTS